MNLQIFVHSYHSSVPRPEESWITSSCAAWKLNRWEDFNSGKLYFTSTERFKMSRLLKLLSLHWQCPFGTKTESSTENNFVRQTCHRGISYISTVLKYYNITVLKYYNITVLKYYYNRHPYISRLKNLGFMWVGWAKLIFRFEKISSLKTIMNNLKKNFPIFLEGEAGYCILSFNF